MGVVAKHVLLATVGGVLLLAAACQRESEEERILSLLREMERATQAHQLTALLQPLTDDFRGHPLASKAEISSVLTYYFLQYKHINVLVTGKEIAVTGGRASVNLQVLAAAADGMVPERAQNLRIQADLEKREGAWRVTRAAWEPVSSAGGGS